MAKFLCMRSKMGLCKRTDCDHNASHDLTNVEKEIAPCSDYYLCDKMNIHTRCIEVNT